MSRYSVVAPQVHEVMQGFLVLGGDIHCCGVACACGVEVGRGIAPAAAAAAAVEAAIVAAVREGTGACSRVGWLLLWLLGIGGLPAPGYVGPGACCCC